MFSWKHAGIPYSRTLKHFICYVFSMRINALSLQFFVLSSVSKIATFILKALNKMPS